MIRYTGNKWLRLFIDKINNKKIRVNILQALPYWVAALLTGLVAVLFTKLFSICENLSYKIISGHEWILFILTPSCFLIAWWIVKRFDENAGGSGIPQVIAAIELASPKHNHLVDKLLSLKSIFVKIISTLFMILGGGVVGREGPTVQIAGSIFRIINNLLPGSWPKISKKNMIMTGAAAGLAAAFNTPLGGIVFAVEELAKTHIKNFKTALFTGVILAGITAQGFLGPYLYLGYPEINNLPTIMIVFVIIVACLAGLFGSFMSVTILRIIKWKRTLKSNSFQVGYVLVCGLLIATMAYFFSNAVLGSGKAQITRVLFTPDKHVGFILPFLRMMGSVICFTTGASGGVFAPALAAGATIGALTAEVFNFTASSANILILAGMVAFLTGVTRSPFTSAILVLEMTDRHSVVFYLMLAGLAANLMANVVDKDSLYERLKTFYLHDVHETDEEEMGPSTESNLSSEILNS